VLADFLAERSAWAAHYARSAIGAAQKRRQPRGL